MVKTVNPLFSITAAGNFKKTIIYTSSKGVSIAKKFFKSKDTKSASQVARRELYKSGATLWKNLTEEQKALYNYLATGKSLIGFNIFMHEYLISGGAPVSLSLYDLGIYDISVYKN